MHCNALRMVERRALVREHGLRGYSRLRKTGLIAFLWDNIRSMPAQSIRSSNVHYDALRMVKLRALMRECRLRGYSKLRKAGLITLLWDIIRPAPAQSVRSRLPKPMRPPSPPPEDSFNPYELKQVLGAGSLEFLNQWKESDGCGNLP